MAGGGGNEPNLTPFIDLFSVLICFLLMSAAWIQLEVMPSNIEKATASDAPSSAPPPPPDEKKVQLAIDMTPQQIQLKEDEKVVSVPYRGPEMDVETVTRVLQDWKSRHPSKNDVILNTESQVMYGEMIKMYDLLVARDFPDVGINPQ